MKDTQNNFWCQKYIAKQQINVIKRFKNLIDYSHYAQVILGKLSIVNKN